ncbi:MAG: PDZ domain-containing protein [SAR202 cluster bacterium]|nr:PDZ domain-containing protein [SAR202 cluster bacterium]
MKSTKTFVYSTLVMAMVLGVFAVGAVLSPRLMTSTHASPVLYDEEQVVSLYQRSNPAVVEVRTVSQSAGGFFRPAAPATGQGSGFLVDDQGHILTNYHVVQNATQVRVTLHDGRSLDARVVRTGPADDMALLQVDAAQLSGITPLPLGDSDSVRPGSMAAALGSPLGLDGSITVGVVSGVDRSRPGIAGRPITGMIQTDASINPGNSGGPLLNSAGEVIGINTSIEQAPNGGIGFAVPVNTAKLLLAQGNDESQPVVRRPWLGISGMNLTPELAQFLDINTDSGVYVLSVSNGSPAQSAGLRAASGGNSLQPGPGGDVITALNERSVQTIQGLVQRLNEHKPGDVVRLTVHRDGQTIQLNVTLGEWPDTISR